MSVYFLRIELEGVRILIGKGFIKVYMFLEFLVCRYGDLFFNWVFFIEVFFDFKIFVLFLEGRNDK